MAYPPGEMLVTTPGQRPPTPPKAKPVTQLIDDAIAFLDTSDAAAVDAAESYRTPPPSSPPAKARSKDKSTKKIRFDDNLHLIASSSPDNGGSSQGSLRNLGSSRDSRKHSRSILKPYDPSNFARSTDTDVSLSSLSLEQSSPFDDMLEAIVKQLSSNDRALKVDAYLALQNCLRGYKAQPEKSHMRQKLPLFESFIQRDIDCISEITGERDGKLASLAMKLLLWILHHDDIAKSLSRDFENNLLDRIIVTLEDDRFPKEVVKAQTQILANESFLTRTYRTERTKRLLDALINVHDHVKGESIRVLRYVVYQKLFQLAPAVMVLKISDLLPQIFDGALSNISETRKQAVAAGAIAATFLGHSRWASDAMIAYLELELKGGGQNFDRIESVLYSWLSDPETRLRVTPVWSTVIMFLRSDPHCLEMWPRLGRWLKIIQACFNSSAIELNVEAWTAWNNLIYSVNPTGETSQLMRRHLVTPIFSTLIRKAPASVREAAWSSLCVLIYYAFRPGTSPETFREYWRDLIHEAVVKLSSCSSNSSTRLFKIVLSVLGATKLKLWDVNRYQDTFADPIAPEELPRIDSQWIRRNLEPVLETIRALMMLSPKHSQHLHNISCVIKRVFRSVSEAAAKEIKTTTEQKSALAIFLNFLTSTVNPSARTFAPLKAEINLTFMICLSGPLKYLPTSLFVEPLLTRSKTGQFQSSASLPRSNPNVSLPPSASALVAVFQILKNCEILAPERSDCRNAMLSIVKHCVSAKTSASDRVNILKSILDACEPQPGSSAGSDAFFLAWDVVSSMLNEMVIDERKLPSHDMSTSIIAAHRTICQILLQGTRAFPAAIDSWDRLFRHLHSLIHDVLGDGGIVYIMISPMLSSEIIQRSQNPMMICSIANSLMDARLPRATSSMIEGAHKKLWSSHPGRALSRSVHEWKDTYLGIVLRSLEIALELFKERDLTAIAVLNSFLSFFDNSCLEDQHRIIQSVEPVLCRWILCPTFSADHDGSTEHQDAQNLLANIWQIAMRLIVRHGQSTEQNLQKWTDLFITGFSTGIFPVAKMTMEAWNSSFGGHDEISYRTDLSDILTKLRSFVAIETAGFDSQHSPGTSQLSETCSMDNSKEMFPWLRTVDIRNLSVLELNKSSAPPINLGTARLLQTPAHPTHARRTTPKSKPRNGTPPRPRHEDSQIQFVAIDSSPVEYKSLNSQALTEHQREVRERQLINAAAFLDMHSTPVVATGRSSVKTKAGRQPPATLNINMSDPLPNDMEEVESSPLVRSKSGFDPRPDPPTKAFNLDSDDADFPSSPPSVERPPIALDLPTGSKTSFMSRLTAKKPTEVADVELNVVEDGPTSSPLRRRSLNVIPRTQRPHRLKSRQNDEPGHMTRRASVRKSHGARPKQPVTETESDKENIEEEIPANGPNTSRVVDSFAAQTGSHPSQDADESAQETPERAESDDDDDDEAPPARRTRSSVRLQKPAPRQPAKARAVLDPRARVQKSNKAPVVVASSERRLRSQKQPVATQPERPSSEVAVYDASKGPDGSFDEAFAHYIEGQGMTHTHSGSPAPHAPSPVQEPPSRPTRESQEAPPPAHSTRAASKRARPVADAAPAPAPKRARLAVAAPRRSARLGKGISHEPDDAPQDAAAPPNSPLCEPQEPLSEPSSSPSSSPDDEARHLKAEPSTPPRVNDTQGSGGAEAAAAAAAQQTSDAQSPLPSSSSSSFSFTFAPPAGSPSMLARARSLIGGMQKILGAARLLVLGPGEEAQRRELEDLGWEVQREIACAGRRGRG